MRRSLSDDALEGLARSSRNTVSVYQSSSYLVDKAL